MKHLNVLFASLAWTCVAMFPAAALADDLDDLEVTMEVLDAESDFDETVTEMRGPENNDIEFDDQDDDDFRDREDGGGHGVEDGDGEDSIGDRQDGDVEEGGDDGVENDAGDDGVENDAGGDGVENDAGGDGFENEDGDDMARNDVNEEDEIGVENDFEDGEDVDDDVFHEEEDGDGLDGDGLDGDGLDGDGNDGASDDDNVGGDDAI